MPCVAKDLGIKLDPRDFRAKTNTVLDKPAGRLPESVLLGARITAQYSVLPAVKTGVMQGHS